MINLPLNKKFKVNIPKVQVFKTEKHFSVKQLLIFALAFGAVGAFFIFRSFADTPMTLVANLEAETMSMPVGSTVIQDATSTGQALKFTQNGVSAADVSLSSAVTSVSVSARSDNCSGSPAFNLSIDGTSVLNVTSVSTSSYVSTSAYTVFTAPVNLSAGLHKVSVTASNVGPGSRLITHRKCSRVLYIDVISFYASILVSPPVTPPPPITSSVSDLTVVATDGVVSNAVCINTSASTSTARTTACIQINPSNPSQARGGIYDIKNKQFTASGIWTALSDLVSATKLSSKVCTNNNHAFGGLGPLGSTYYGEEISGTNVTFGTFDTSSGTCTTSGGGTLDSNQWATSSISCSASAVQITSAAQLASSVGSMANGTEFCIASGTYVLSATIRPKTGMKFIGNPINRPVFDSGNLTGVSTGAFTIGGTNAATDVTIANVVVSNAPTPGQATCATCGMGIDVEAQGDNVHVYNVKMTNNKQNGFHFYHNGAQIGYVVENSEISNNGNLTDVGWTSGGLKTTHGGTLKHNVVLNNLGVGLWCDVKCTDTTWTVQDNYTADNTRAGIRYEISYLKAVITNNVVVHNFTSGSAGQKNGGVSLVHTQNVTLTSNIFRNNISYGIVVFDDVGRGLASSNITATNNTMNGDGVNCITASTIVCTPNN